MSFSSADFVLFFCLALYIALQAFCSGLGFMRGMLRRLPLMVDTVSWHAHEMIYGFTLAIIAGFLLTAVANWTGGAPVRQMQLAGLCALWLVGRIVINFDAGLPFWLVCALGTAFIPALAVSISIPLLKSWNKRNFVFLGLLSALFACDISFMLSENRLYLHIALLMIAAMISLSEGALFQHLQLLLSENVA